MTRRLTNQDAFDGAMLNLLNQGHSCVSASGQARYRGPRGKSAIGALIPDELYLTSMEGKKVHHWLAANTLFRAIPFAVERFVLFSSFLSKTAAIYRPEAEYPLLSA